MNTIKRYPILTLLVINILVGLFTFQSYGYAWDEPLFYEYADALPYAYSPSEWFSGHFDVNNAFGPSATDHANRGPAYILLARPLTQLIQVFDIDQASAWHLVNFLTFQLGVYLLYRLASKWMNKSASVATAAFFSWQPLLWGHAFINPKDIPFLTFFLGSVCFGIEMVDELKNNARPHFGKTLLAAFFLGIATSIRVLGPFAAILVGLYALIDLRQIKFSRLAWRFILYGFLTLIVTFATWPYLWLAPLQKFVEVFFFMSDNPTQLNVLFAGSNYQAGDLPHRYFPLLLGYTLSEPTYFLIAIGMVLGFWKADTKKRLVYGILLLWFGTLVAYIFLRRPAMYDGYRHFLFILPPLFIFAGFAFEALFNWLKSSWQKIAVTVLLLGFGIIPIIQLHPYQYAYYNNFAGSVGGVFREYETEYWLTCYREAVLKLNETAPEGTQLFVRREPYIAAYYVNSNITVRDFRTEQKDMKSGDYYLANSRSNEDLKFLGDEPAVVEVSRQGATFCVIKQVP